MLKLKSANSPTHQRPVALSFADICERVIICINSEGGCIVQIVTEMVANSPFQCQKFKLD